jgi:molybdopterin molybdotransferase
MAQLTDDCFAFGGDLLPIDEMERIIRDRVRPVVETEAVPLGQTRGRVLAQDVAAPVSLPPFDNSAVDGFAVRHVDLNSEGDTRLKVVERLTAGLSTARPLAPGTAVRIFTGAPMPRDADTVFMQEDTRVEDDVVVLPAGLKRGANRRLTGEDVQAGSVILKAGSLLSASHIALAAAVGLTQLTVRRRLRVALFSTGDEIAEPGSPLSRAATYDANRFLLAALLDQLGALITNGGILRDNREQVAQALQSAARDHDLVLTSGGVSTGDADYVRETIERLGTLVFWRIGIKPGRPVAMGVLGGAALVGLPGNPVAAFVTFVKVVRPLLMQLSGAKIEPLMPLPVRAAFAYRKKKGRREYVRVKLTRATDGVLEATKHRQEGAGVITSLTETDGLVELPEDVTTVERGSTVGFLPYAVLSG